MDAVLVSIEKANSRPKIKKKNPARKRFNKTLPAGILYTIEYDDKRGRRMRIRSFLVKSVKAEITVQITIEESAELKGAYPEWIDVVKSFDVAKKKR